MVPAGFQKVPCSHDPVSAPKKFCARVIYRANAIKHKLTKIVKSFIIFWINSFVLYIWNS
jgi:hypothetical protein